MLSRSVVGNLDGSTPQRRGHRSFVQDGRLLPRRGERHIHSLFLRRTYSLHKLECISLHNCREFSNRDQIGLISHNNATKVCNVFVPQRRPILELVPPLCERFERLWFVDVVHQHYCICPTKERRGKAREPFLTSSVLPAPYGRSQSHSDLRSKDPRMTHPYL